MAAEFQRQDMFSDDLLKAPLELKWGMEVLLETMDKLQASAKGYEKAISSATSVGSMKKNTDELTTAQTELEKIQKRMITIQAKSTEEVIKGTDALNKLKQAQKDKTRLGDRDAKTVRAQNASYKVLEAALSKNKRAYKELGDEQARTGKEGKELIKIINTQDKELKKLGTSMGENFKNVGDYRNAIMEALGPLGHFEGMLGPLGSGLRASGTAMQGAAKGANILKVAMLAIPIFLLIAAITSLVTYFTKTEDGAQKLRIIMAYVEEAFSGVVDVVIALGRWLSELTMDKVTQGFKDFGDVIKNFVLSRIELLIKGLGGVGESFALLFQGEFKQAAKTAGQAFIDIQRGINPVVMQAEVLVAGYNAVTDAVVDWGKEVHKEAMTAVQLQKDENAAMAEHRKWIVEEERLTNKLNEAKDRASDQRLTDQERLEAMYDAVKALDALEIGRLHHAKESLRIAEGRAALGEVDEATLDHIAELEKEVLAIQNRRLTGGKILTGQISALEEKMYADILKAREDIRKRSDKDLTDAIAQAKLRTKHSVEQMSIQLSQEAQMIQQAVLNGTLTRKEGDDWLLKQRKAAAAKMIEENVKQLEKELQAVIRFNEQRLLVTGITEAEMDKIRSESAEEQKIIAEQIAKLQVQLTDTIYNNLEDNQLSSLDKAAIFVEEMLAIYTGFADALGSLFATLTENRLANIDKEEERYEAQTEKELKLAGDNDSRKSEIENEANRRHEEFDRKRIQAQRKQAIFDKLTSAVQAGIATALAIIKMLANPGGPVGIGLSIAAGVTGAIQVAAILAKQIPQYWEGTDNHPGGPFIGGEKGTEMVITPAGKLSLTPSHATVMSGPPGTRVIDHDETMRVLARAGIDAPAYVGSGGVNIGSELGIYFRELTHVIQNKRETHYNWTRTGLEKAFKNGQSRQYFKDHFYK